MRRIFLAGIILLTSVNPIVAQPAPLEAYWDDGLKFRSKDDKFKFSAGGRVHLDAAFSGQSGALDSLVGKASDNVQIRRARLSFEGTINNMLAYEAEFDFGKTVDFADVYLAFIKLPFFDRLMVGYFREPFGMEQVTSSNTVVFMERSLPTAFGRPRNTGVMVRKKLLNNKLTAYAGFFRITNDVGIDEEAEGKHSFSSRWAFVPLLDTIHNKVLHIGAGLNIHSPQQQKHSVEAQNESDLSPTYISTGDLSNTRRVHQISGEFGYTKNRLAIMSEYVHSFANFDKDTLPVSRRTPRFNSFYTTVSYFLTGGKRGYNSNRNSFSSINISKDNVEANWRGAWEIALRFSYINIADVGKEMNTMSNTTLGINWYFNSNTRLMMNYIFTMLSSGYKANVLQFRMQFTF